MLSYFFIVVLFFLHSAGITGFRSTVQRTSLTSGSSNGGGRTIVERRVYSVTRLEASIIETIQKDPNFSTFSTLLEGVPDLKTLLADENIGSGGGNIFTVFAPTNSAFTKLSKDQLFKLGKKDNLPILRKIVRFHFHEDVLSREEIASKRELSTLALLPVTVKPADGGFKLNEANIVRDLPICSNGRIYEVDTLLNPVLLYRYLV